MNSATLILDSTLSFIHITLDTNTHHAGDRIKGHILLNTKSTHPESRLIMTSTGFESLSVTTCSNSISSYKNEIFHVSSTIQTWDTLPSSSQYSFPFSFKLPFYAPASFEFDSHDSNSNTLKASVQYTIQASLHEKDTIILSDEINLTVLSNKARNKPQESKLDIRLLTCCCIRKGNSHITLGQIEKTHPAYGQLCRFHLEINWEKYKGQIKAVRGSVFYKLQLSIPGDKTYEFTQELFDFNHSQSFLSKSDAVIAFNEFDVLLEGNFAENASSNETAMINSSFIAEAEINFTFNVTHQNLKIQLPVYVNPRESLDREFLVTGEWNPDTQEIRSVYLQTKTGQNIFSPSKSSLVESFSNI